MSGSYIDALDAANDLAKQGKDPSSAGYASVASLDRHPRTVGGRVTFIPA